MKRNVNSQNKGIVNFIIEGKERVGMSSCAIRITDMVNFNNKIKRRGI